MYLNLEEVNSLIEKIESAQTIIIHRHVSPDPDAIGSQLGLKTLIKNGYPTKHVLAAGTISQGLKWLGEMDQVSREDYESALVIVVDTANHPRIDTTINPNYIHWNIKIDHHPDVDQYADFQIVHTKASSTSELISFISRYSDERLPMDDVAARYLYAGILGDTGRFMYNSTTPLTFDAAAYLIQFDFNAQYLSDMMAQITLDEARFHGYFYEKLAIEDGVAYVTITQEEMKEFNITEEQSNSTVNLPSRLAGVYSWVTFVEQEGSEVAYRCRIRSKGPVINGIASNHDGGGHPMASGANVYSTQELEELVEEMKQAVEKYLNEKEAKDAI